MTHSELGTVALACAAGDDVTAWCLLALLVSVGSATPQAAFVVLASTAVFIAVMAFVIQPIVRRWITNERLSPANVLGGVLIGVLMSALATEAIGIHAIFERSCSAASSRAIRLSRLR